MNNFMIHKVKLTSIGYWLGSGAKALFKNPFCYSSISLFWLLAFALSFWVGISFQQNILVASLMAVGISLVFPFTLASIAIALRRKQNSLPLSPRLIMADFVSGYTFRLVVTYILLVLAASLGSSTLEFYLPKYAQGISYLVEVIFVVLQFLAIIAIPANVALSGAIKPYHALGYAFKAFLINFIPCILFMLSFFVVLFGAILLAQLFSTLVGRYAIIVYVLELWLLATWVSLSASLMAAQLIGAKTSP